MKKKPLAYYLDLMKSAQEKQEWAKGIKYGETALRKLYLLSYSPHEEYLLHTRLAYAYFNMADFSRSLDNFYKAHLIASTKRLAPSYIAYASFGIGNDLLAMKNITQAFPQFRKAEEYYQKYGDNNPPMNKQLYLHTLMALGYCYLYKNNLDEAGEIIDKKVLLYKSILSSNKFLSQNYYHVRGEYLMAKKDYDQARQSFQDSINLDDQFNLSHLSFGSKIHLATIDLFESNVESAIQSLESLIKSARRLKFNDIICEISLFLSKCYSLKNLSNKATAIENRIKPYLNKVDINWFYEISREFERLYKELQPIYSRYSSGRNLSCKDSVPKTANSYIPQFLIDTLKKHYAPIACQIIGQSNLMQEIYHLIDKIAPTDLPVLIQGETGTGKELVAQAIYQNSLRKGTIWLALNCGTIPETLLENTLFGQVKGAFTDAQGDKKGYIETASGGTLLLDEIGDMSPAMQQKLLRVLEEKLVWPVGSEKPIPVDTRFIFASNQNIEELVKQKRFRLDLFHRINTIVIALPPLRERKEDIPLLVNYFLKKYSTKRMTNGQFPITKEALELLINYHWNGNVRELENEIKRICTLHPEATIITDLMLSDIIRNYQSATTPTPSSLKELKSLAEKNIIIECLKKHNGNIARSGRELGYLRPNLSRKIKQLGISVKDYVTKK